MDEITKLLNRESAEYEATFFKYCDLIKDVESAYSNIHISGEGENISHFTECLRQLFNWKEMRNELWKEREEQE